jgi:hypothetical protein
MGNRVNQAVKLLISKLQTRFKEKGRLKWKERPKLICIITTVNQR